MGKTTLMQQQGFNLFVVGPEGCGRHTVVESFIHDKASKEATPGDWCYVHNFHQPINPWPWSSPKPGDDYRVRLKAINDLLAQKIEVLCQEVKKEASV